MPLALATAGAYLGLTSISLLEYLHHHDTSWLELQQTSPQLLSYEDQTIYSTWNLSYIYIRKEDESAAKLLELWAYFDNRDLWYDLLQAGEYKAPGWFLDVIKTKLTFTSVIAKLQKHALVERLIESDGYSMHHCVHAWVRNVLCKAVDSQNMRLALTCIGVSVPVDPVPGDWIIRQRLLPHSESCLRHSRVWSGESNDLEETDDRVLQCIHGLAILYHYLGKLTEAAYLYQRVLAREEKLLGEDHISTLTTVHNLGLLYRDQGKLMEAESMYQRALIGTENALGKDHTKTLETINNLGILYMYQGKLREAESMYQRALPGFTRNPLLRAKSQLDLFYNMGLLYRRLGNFESAKEFFNQAYEGSQKHLGSQHAETIDALKQLNIENERDIQGAESSLGKKHKFAPARLWRRRP